jgi:CBS domain-containing protein
MHTVREILEKKGREVWTIPSSSPLQQALSIMAERDIGALLVMDEGRIAGIFSERDYARKVVLKGRSSADTIVRDIMSTDVITIQAGQSIDECMNLMTNRHIRHLPVVEGGAVRGMISIGDVVKVIISEQESTIRHLEQYISGGR